MKNTLFLAVAIVLATTSCNRFAYLPNTQTSTQPYVKLKSGARYNSSSAERNSGLFVKDKIVLGDTSFRTKDVAFYATGSNTYANIGKKTFATQVAAGKINLYRYEYTTTSYSAGNSGPGGMGAMGNGMGSYQTHKHISYYIQKKEDAPVVPLCYSLLKPMVEKGTPEFAMLERYQKTRVVTRTLGYSTLGLFVGGIALMATSDNVTTQGVGAVMFGTSLLVTAPTFVVWRGSNHGRLLKAVRIADGDRKLLARIN